MYLDFNEARDNGVAVVASSGPYANQLQIRQITMPAPHYFLQATCSSWHRVNGVKALKASLMLVTRCKHSD